MANKMALIRLDKMVVQMTNPALEVVMKEGSAEDLTGVHMGAVIIIDVVTDNKIIIITGKMDQEVMERMLRVKKVVQLAIETSQSIVGMEASVAMIVASNVDDHLGAQITIDVAIFEEQDAVTPTKENHLNNNNNNNPQKRHNKINLI